MAGGIKLAPLLTEIKVNIANFRNEMDKVKTAGVTAMQDMSKKMSTAIKVGESFKSVGATLTKSVTLPLMAAGVASTKLASDFETSLAKLSTIADTNTKSIETLRKETLNFSNETGVAATEVNEALYQAISAGVDTADAMGVLDVANKAAKGGFTDLGTAIDGLTNVVNSYGLETSDAEEIANQMLITQNKGKTTFGELATSMSKVTPISSQLGISTKELLSSLASTTAQGLNTSESVTALKAAMSNIIKPSKEAADAAEALGIEFSVSALQSKGWMGFLTDVKEGLRGASPEMDNLIGAMDRASAEMDTLSKAGKENSEEYKHAKKRLKSFSQELELMSKVADSPVSAMATMFGSVEGLNSILMLTSESGMNIYNETMKEMDTNTTALQDAFNKMDATPAETMAKAWNKVKNSFIEVGAVILPVIANLMDKIGTLASKFGSLDEATKKNVVIFGVLIAAIGPVLSMVGSGIGLFANCSIAFSGLSAAAAAAGVSIGALVAPVAIAVAAIVGLGIAVATNFGGIRDTITSIMNNVGEIISTVVNRIKSLWESNFMGIQTFTIGAWNQIKMTFKTVFDAIKDIFNVFTKVFQGDWKGAWEAVKELGTNVWNNIKSLFSNFLNTVVDTLLNIGVNLYTAAVDAWENVKRGASEKWESFKSWFSGAIKDPIGTIKGIGSAMYNAGRDMLNSVWDGCKSIWSSITGWFNKKVNWIKERLTFWKSSKSEMSEDGSHYNGLSYVPFDGYMARLHKGERVLTAKEAQDYRFNGNSNSTGNGNFNITINSPTPIDAAEADRIFRRTQRNIALGFC